MGSTVSSPMETRFQRGQYQKKEFICHIDKNIRGIFVLF